MPAKVIGIYQEERIIQVAGRRKGVTAPEVSEAFDCSRQTAWNTLERLRKAGRLIKTERKRRRWMLFKHAGQGSFVYVANPNPGGSDEQAG